MIKKIIITTVLTLIFVNLSFAIDDIAKVNTLGKPITLTLATHTYTLYTGMQLVTFFIFSSLDTRYCILFSYPLYAIR